jgi:hypothetical protein
MQHAQKDKMSYEDRISILEELVMSVISLLIRR